MVLKQALILNGCLPLVFHGFKFSCGLRCVFQKLALDHYRLCGIVIIDIDALTEFAL